jgi:hypothetical protein
MKLPKTLPPLEEPSFVLANPVAVQVGVLLAILAGAFAAIAWVGTVWLAGGAGVWHSVVVVISLAGLSAVAYPRNWHRWVIFAADARGVYLARFQGDYLHVPWGDVGPGEIGVAGRGSNRQRTVILPLRLDEAALEHLLGKHQKRATRIADPAGFVPYGIGNAMQDVDATLAQIEAVRQASRPIPNESTPPNA